MMKEIKAIRLEFENVDYMIFEPKDFAYFSIDDIWTEIRTCGFGIDKFVHADTVEMQIKWEANDWHKPFENDDASHDEFKFDRIQDYDDITHISVVYDDETTERYTVNWEDATENGEENKKQISVTINDGLLIRIANDVWWDTKDSGKKWRYEQTDKEKEEEKVLSGHSDKLKRYLEGKNENATETIVRCKDCCHAGECHKSVQYTQRAEPNTVTIGYSPIEWCSRGERKEDGNID